jgi:tetratricopeptide (TPR) repeat protein
MALGRAYQNKARSANSAAPSLFSATTARATILKLDDATTAKLGRLDLLYAAQAMLLHARDLNPLYVDHTVNLARFYVPDLPVDTPSKSKLADLSNQYYAEAIRLNPNSQLLWNEWADFDLTTRTDPDAALEKLNAALARDAQFAPTYLNLGKVYVAKNNFARARDAYQRALALQPDLVEAQSRLAFVYYQEGRPAESIVAYLKYVELAPDAANLWEAHKNLAILYKQMGNLAAAIDEARTAIRLAPDQTKLLLVDLEAQLRNQSGKP